MCVSNQNLGSEWSANIRDYIKRSKVNEWNEKLKLMVQVDKIRNEKPMIKYWNDSEQNFVRLMSDGSYTTNIMIIRVKLRNLMDG